MRKSHEHVSKQGAAMNPGSDEAIKQGCTCPVMDNARGRGIMGGEELGFWITAGCPLHGQEIKSPESERFTQERT